MNKAKTATVVSLAVANMTAIGLAASPASAAAHLTTSTAGHATATTAPSADRAHPALALKLPYRVGLVTNAQKPRGFVPRTESSGAIPFTETGCSGHVCLGLYGGANFVSYTNQHFFGTGGCHIGWLSVFAPNGALEAKYTAFSPNGGYHYFCSKQEFSVPFYASYATGTNFCGHFQNVSGQECEAVR